MNRRNFLKVLAALTGTPVPVLLSAQCPTPHTHVLRQHSPYISIDGEDVSDRVKSVDLNVFQNCVDDGDTRFPGLQTVRFNVELVDPGYFLAGDSVWIAFRVSAAKKSARNPEYRFKALLVGQTFNTTSGTLVIASQLWEAVSAITLTTI